MKQVRWRLGAVLWLLTVGCGADGGVGGTAPNLAPTPPPAVTVSFLEDAITVSEGETVEVAVRYQVNELASPLALTISPLDKDTAPEDYELSAMSFEIPSGRGVSGTAALSFTALLDEWVAEGDEKMSIRLVQPQGVRATLDQNLEVTIAESGGNPCSGLAVVGTPPEEREIARWRVHATTLALSVAAHAADVVVFDWESPYFHDAESEWWVGVSPALEASAVEWEVESLSNVTRHAIRVQWERGQVLRLRFRSAEGTCDYQRDELVCDVAGCILRGSS